jgi:hypothetical protein
MAVPFPWDQYLVVYAVSFILKTVLAHYVTLPLMQCDAQNDEHQT